MEKSQQCPQHRERHRTTKETFKGAISSLGLSPTRQYQLQKAIPSPCKALGQLPEAVERVQVWALAVPGQRLTVQLDAVDGLKTGLVQVARGTEVREDALRASLPTTLNGPGDLEVRCRGGTDRQQ